MIAWWSVTFASSTTRASGSTSSDATYSAPFAVLGLRADQLGDRLDLLDHVGRQVARVRARVGERLVLLVEPLGGGEGAPRREAEAVVRLALQGRQVIEHRRLLALLSLLDLCDLARAARGRRDDRVRLLLGPERGPLVGAGLPGAW